MILLRKKSANSFGEDILLNSTGLLSFLLTLRRHKIDKIEISKRDIRFTIKSKIILQREFDQIDAVNYNSLKEVILVNTSSKSHTLSVKAFRISYDEAKLIRERLIDFNKSLKVTS